MRDDLRDASAPGESGGDDAASGPGDPRRALSSHRDVTVHDVRATAERHRRER